MVGFTCAALMFLCWLLLEHGEAGGLRWAETDSCRSLGVMMVGDGVAFNGWHEAARRQTWTTEQM